MPRRGSEQRNAVKDQGSERSLKGSGRPRKGSAECRKDSERQRNCPGKTVKSARRGPSPTSSGSEVEFHGHACVSVMCQCRTFKEEAAIPSSSLRISGTGSKCRPLSTISPRCGKRGASAMLHGAPAMRYSAASKSKRTCRNVYKGGRSFYKGGQIIYKGGRIIYKGGRIIYKGGRIIYKGSAPAG